MSQFRLNVRAVAGSDRPASRRPRMWAAAMLSLLVCLSSTVGCSTSEPATEEAANEPQPVDNSADQVSDDDAAEPDGDASSDTEASGDSGEGGDEGQATAPERLAMVEEADSVLAVIAEHPNLTAFAALVDAYPHREVFTQARGITLVVPDDAAMAKIDEGTYDNLLTDPDAFTVFLSAHMSIGTQLQDSLVGGGAFTSALADSVPTAEGENGTTIGDATIVQADLTAENGVVHIVDRPLVEP